MCSSPFHFEMCLGGLGSLVCVSFPLFLQFVHVLPLVLRPEQTVVCVSFFLYLLPWESLYTHQVYNNDDRHHYSNGVLVAIQLCYECVNDALSYSTILIGDM